MLQKLCLKRQLESGNDSQYRVSSRKMGPEQRKVPGSQGSPTGNPEDAGTGSCLPPILFQVSQALNTLLGLPVIALNHCHIVSMSRIYVSFSLLVTLFALQHQSRNLEGCPKCSHCFSFHSCSSWSGGSLWPPVHRGGFSSQPRPPEPLTSRNCGQEC